MSCEAATQTELGPGSAPAPGSVTVTEHGTVTLRQGRGKRKPRPNSMVDYQSYRDTKLLVARFLEQSSCSLTPEVQELVNSIKTVLRSDEEHMEEAVRCASFIDQARHMAWKHVKLPRTQSTCSDTWSFGAQGGELSLNPACFLLSIILDTPDFYGSYTVWYKTIWSSYLRKKRS